MTHSFPTRRASELVGGVEYADPLPVPSDVLRRLAPETLRVVERAPVYRVEPAGHACPPCIREKLLHRMPPQLEGGMAPSPIIGSPTALQRTRCGDITAKEGHWPGRSRSGLPHTSDERRGGR